MDIQQILGPNFWPLLAVISLWSLPWKGYALWQASKRGDKKWFIALFILNTVAILEILYIFIFSHRTRTPRAKDEMGTKGRENEERKTTRKINE